jgi:hypothetical protein
MSFCVNWTARPDNQPSAKAGGMSSAAISRVRLRDVMNRMGAMNPLGCEARGNRMPATNGPAAAGRTTPYA